MGIFEIREANKKLALSKLAAEREAYKMIDDFVNDDLRKSPYTSLMQSQVSIKRNSYIHCDKYPLLVKQILDLNTLVMLLQGNRGNPVSMHFRSDGEVVWDRKSLHGAHYVDESVTLSGVIPMKGEVLLAKRPYETIEINTGGKHERFFGMKTPVKKKTDIPYFTAHPTEIRRNVDVHCVDRRTY